MSCSVSCVTVHVLVVVQVREGREGREYRMERGDRPDRWLTSNAWKPSIIKVNCHQYEGYHINRNQ